MNKEEFILFLSKMGIKISNDKLKMLDEYYDLLKEWNEKINLTSIIDYDMVYLKHYYDSLTLFRVVNLNDNLTLCDVGCGAGFPGMVLKIVFPNLKVVLVDALLKRVNFLKIVIEKLGLTNIEVYHARCEDFMMSYHNCFDIVTSRAVCNLDKLSKMCLPLVKKNGFFIPMKANFEEELQDAKSTIIKMNGNIEIIDNFLLPKEESVRTIIKIKKINETNLNSLNKIKKSIILK